MVVAKHPLGSFPGARQSRAHGLIKFNSRKRLTNHVRLPPAFLGKPSEPRTRYHGTIILKIVHITVAQQINAAALTLLISFSHQLKSPVSCLIVHFARSYPRTSPQ
jgi:hypothetical protein